MTPVRYHHGDLRRVLLAAAVDAINDAGPAALSLRDLARRADVSHAAPAHHFSDKAGLITALATEGYDRLAAGLDIAQGDLLELGLAYVRFALGHPAHFQVMFAPGLCNPDDPELIAAKRRAFAPLQAAVDARPAAKSPEARRRDALAAWSKAHGFATLWLAGALPPELGTDPETVAREILSRGLRG